MSIKQKKKSEYYSCLKISDYASVTFQVYSIKEEKWDVRALFYIDLFELLIDI